MAESKKKVTKKVTPKKTTTKIVKKVTPKKVVTKKTTVKPTKKAISKTVKKLDTVKKSLKKTSNKTKSSSAKISQTLSQTIKSKSNKNSINWIQGHMVLVSWAFSVFLLGCLLGSFSMDTWIMKSFGKDTKMVVTQNQTWLPVAGKPIDLVVLNDKNCGEACNATPQIDALKQNISPALITRTIDTNSKEGKKLIAQNDIVTIPQFFFGKSLESVKDPSGKSFIKNLPEGILTFKDGMYALNKTAIGFPAGKFIKTPTFKDLDTEPKKGTGKVQVVEFTDYQCPYCKRLHDQNKDLISRLIAENKITYVLKDFPLGFHGESAFAHKAASCVLKNSDQDTYWKMHDQIFDTMDDWNRKGEKIAVDHFNKLAKKLGVDITECVKTSEVSQELAADQLEGQKFGVRGTPALFIGTQQMPGAIGSAAFEKAVNEELQK